MWKISFDFCQIIPFLWNYDHFSFQEVIEFLVGKDAVLGKSWNAISSLATFAGASSVILLKLHWSAAETLHTTKRGPLKCSRRYMATKRPVFWFFNNLPKKMRKFASFFFYWRIELERNTSFTPSICSEHVFHAQFGSSL